MKIIKQKLKYNKNAEHRIRRLKWKWVGHMVRIKEDRWAKRITLWYLGNYERRRGRHHIGWRENIDKPLGQKLFQRIAVDRKE